MNWWLLRRKLHTSWLLCGMAWGILGGVVIARYMPAGLFGDWLWLFVGLALTGIAVWRQRVYALLFICLGGCVLGLWRGSVDQAHLTVYPHLYHQTLTVEGVVSDDSTTGKATEVIVPLREVTVAGHALPGTIWTSLSTGGGELKRGDHVTIQGQLQPGFGSYAASFYRARLLTIHRPMPGDVAGRLRDGFAQNVKRVIVEPQASLGIGYVVGQRRALPDELVEALQIAGLTHIVVASGYNLTILVRLARRLFVRISKYLAALSASVMIIGFIAITGASPSMTRAGLVAGMSLAAWYYGRKFHPVVLLSLAAAITVLMRPAYLTGDLGWQLSFAAFAGVMLLGPLMQRYFFGESSPSTIRQILGETVAAQIATLPILIFAFGHFSNVALIANLLILPLVPLAMLLTFVAGIGGMVLPVIGLPAQWLLSYMVAVAEYVAHLPWAQTTLQINVFVVVAYYIALLGIGVYMWQRTRFNLREANIVE